MHEHLQIERSADPIDAATLQAEALRQAELTRQQRRSQRDLRPPGAGETARLCAGAMEEDCGGLVETHRLALGCIRCLGCQCSIENYRRLRNL